MLEADPVTGEVKASPAVREALVRGKLAAAHGRRAGAYYLTELGWAVRTQLQSTAGTAEYRADAEPEAGIFAAATGDEVAAEGLTSDRATATKAAFTGLLEIRRVLNTGMADPLAVPAPWERTRMVQAVALTLEAGGIPASRLDAAGRRTRTGYRVLDTDEAGAVRVEWRGPANSTAKSEAEGHLGQCAELLGHWGWDAVVYLGARRLRFLHVTAVRSPAGPDRVAGR